MKSKMCADGEFYELQVEEDLLLSPVFNDDLAPTKISERNWNKWHIMSLWIGMAICVPTYTLGAVLTTYFGLSVLEALWTILAANTIVLIPLILNAFPGTKFGIPFPILLRSSFGIFGSNIPALIRGLVACGWFGIQTLFGGLAFHLILSRFFPVWANLGGTGEVLGFFFFWLINIFIVVKGSESIKLLEVISAPLLILVGIGLLFWAIPQIEISKIISEAPLRPKDSHPLRYILSGLTAMVGFWATLSLNIPDFSRYAKSQRDQVWGQILGLPLTMLLFAMLGVVLTAASPVLVGQTVSDPVTLLGKISNPYLASFGLFIIIISTLSTNAAANILSPANDFQNLLPRLITFKRGVYLTGFIGISLMSWELLRKIGFVRSNMSLETMYSNWLLSYSCLLGPIAGIMITDYFLIKNQHIHLVDIYRVGGAYPKFNWAGITAFLVTVGLTVMSLATGKHLWIYQYGWFVGSFLGAILYYCFNRLVGQEYVVKEFLWE